MRDAVIEEAGRTRIQFVGMFLIVLGVLLILIWAALLVMFPEAVAYFCLLALIAIALGIAYIYAGLGLLKAQIWAFTWTPVFMAVMIVIMLIVAGLSGQILILGIFLPMIIVHALILAIVVLESRKPLEEIAEAARKIPVEAGRVEGLKCRNCGSENVDVYPDNSGYCRDCQAAYLSVKE